MGVVQICGFQIPDELYLSSSAHKTLFKLNNGNGKRSSHCLQDCLTLPYYYVTPSNQTIQTIMQKDNTFCNQEILFYSSYSNRRVFIPSASSFLWPSFSWRPSSPPLHPQPVQQSAHAPRGSSPHGKESSCTLQKGNHAAMSAPRMPENQPW